MTDERVCAWWIRGDELSVTACGRKLKIDIMALLSDEPTEVTWNSDFVTCEECRKVLYAAGLAVVENNRKQV